MPPYILNLAYRNNSMRLVAELTGRWHISLKKKA